MASRLSPTAFPMECLYSLPSIHDLVNNIQTLPKKETADVNTEEDTDDFILVEAHVPTTPMEEVSTLTLEEPKTTEEVKARVSPFVDMIKDEAKQHRARDALGRTENNALTYTTSLHPLVDLFYAVKEQSDAQTIRQHLSAAWKVDPLKALKLVFFLRDIRDGKGCNEEFYVAAQWVLASHPETFKYNVVQFCPRFGYWKDLLELLVRDFLGEEGIEEEKVKAAENKRIFSPDQKMRRKLANVAEIQKHRNRKIRTLRTGLILRDGTQESQEFKEPGTLRAKKLRSQARRAEYANMTPEEAAKARADFAMEVEERQRELQHQVRSERLDRRDNAISKCRVHWSDRKEWQNLHLAIAKQFAVALYLDKLRLDQNKKVSSLCAKWAPSPDHYHDKYTCIATTIACILFPASIHRKENETDEKYVARALKMYQARYLTPLRKAAKVVETLMSAQEWNKINYSHVPSISFKRNKSAFEKHDTNRYAQHVADAAAGKKGKTIHASTLKPHQIIREFLNPHLHGQSSEATELDGQVIEAQWLNYIETIKSKGSLDNCIAIADVSGSMYEGGMYAWPPTPSAASPIEVCIALSLLVAAVSQPPFNQTLITFSANPTFLHIPETCTTLREKVDLVRAMDWGMNTNFQAVFDLILTRAISHNLPKNDMIKTVFVFSDMQFDEAASSPLETDYQQIVRKFSQAGYEVPKMIFWNLSSYGKGYAIPVLYDTIGTAMVSGWSGQLLKLFMESGGEMIQSPEFSPEFVMEKAIGKPAYEVLKIID